MPTVIKWSLYRCVVFRHISNDKFSFPVSLFHSGRYAGLSGCGWHGAERRCNLYLGILFPVFAGFLRMWLVSVVWQPRKNEGFGRIMRV